MFIISDFIFLFLIIFFSLFITNKVTNSFSNNTSIKHKYEYLDALRGISALFVMVFHSYVFYNYSKTQLWTRDFSEINENLLNLVVNMGEGSVTMFFMMTSFLFFDKYILNSTFEYNTFYKKRLFRLVPMYLFSVLCVFILSFILSINPDLNFKQILKSVMSWLSFGYFFSDSINREITYGFILNAGVFWTLIIEWKFYIILPFALFLFNTMKKVIISIPVLLLGNFLYFYTDLSSELSFSIFNYFCIGALAAIINQKIVFSKNIITTLYLIVFIYITTNYKIAYTINGNLIFGLLFLLIICRSSILGILKIKLFQYAGTISYSIYLLHGIWLSLLTFKLLKGYPFLIISGIAIFLTILSSGFTYKYIEEKFIYLGNK